MISVLVGCSRRERRELDDRLDEKTADSCESAPRGSYGSDLWDRGGFPGRDGAKLGECTVAGSSMICAHGLAGQVIFTCLGVIGI